jgi:hypothetical protein
VIKMRADLELADSVERHCRGRRPTEAKDGRALPGAWSCTHGALERQPVETERNLGSMGAPKA